MQGRWDALHAELWPAESQRLLLRALLLRGDDACAAWREWIATRDLADVSVEDSALLPSLSRAAKRLAVEASHAVILSESYRASWLKNQFAIAHLLRVLNAFETLRIPALVLKGVPLLLFYYEDEGARRMADVDLLVPEETLPRVAPILESLGWCSRSGVPPAELLPFHHAMHWQHRSGFHLDLHWHAWTSDAPPEAERALWQRSETRDVRGVRMRIPDPTDLLLLVCYHGRKQDRLARGRWVLDAATIVAARGREIDGRELMVRARECGLAAPVCDALAHIRREYGVSVDGFSDSARPEDRAEGEMRYREIARHALRDRGLAETIASGWWRYAAVQRARGRSPRWIGFLGHYLDDRRWEWGLERRSQVAVLALRKAFRRFLSHGI